MPRSVALSTTTHERLVSHLLRPDGQEDLCFALYHESIGAQRSTALIGDVILPERHERQVHGNVAFTDEYFLRAADRAEVVGAGLVLLHSHPGGHRWQDMSPDDVAAEQGHAAQALALTEKPLLGMTLATGDEAWSGRLWLRGDRAYQRADCATVRIVGDRLAVTRNPGLTREPIVDERLLRTVSAWGPEVQAELAQLQIGVVGLGSVGSMIAETLARIGIRNLVLIDFDAIKEHNLDRVLHATQRDVALARSKVEVLSRALRHTATNAEFDVETAELSLAEPEGWATAMDCDVLFSCVDRPWPRHLLNLAAYAHLIPVVDGGIRVGTNAKGRMLAADWKAHIAAPGRRCLACLGQYDPAAVNIERDGLLDDPKYINSLSPDHPLRASENVFAFSMNTASLEVLQLISMVAAPQGIADLGGQSYHAVTGVLDNDTRDCEPMCPYRHELVATGDTTTALLGPHAFAEKERGARTARAATVRVQLGRLRERLGNHVAGLAE
jgi:molybdopterin-synthase adenylyltransferase